MPRQAGTIRICALAFIALVACTPAPQQAPALDGQWDVQQIDGAVLGEGVRIRLLLPLEQGEALILLRYADVQSPAGE